MREKIELLRRLRKGLTQEKLEDATGLPRGRISKWGNSGEPSGSQALSLARYFGVPVESLLDDEKDVLTIVPGPDPEADMTADELALIEQYRDLGLSRAEAARGLAWAYRTKPEPESEPRKINQTEQDRVRQKSTSARSNKRA